MTDTKQGHCADWLTRQGFNLTDDQRDCIAVLVAGFNCGIYNIPTNWKSMELRNPCAVFLNVRGEVATFDYDRLSRLVFAAHDHCVRFAIYPRGPQVLGFAFHKRKKTEGCLSERHPTLEQAISAFRTTP